MRSHFLTIAAAVFAFGCTEGPSAPLLQPVEASFGTWAGEPPPPWAPAVGTGTAYEHVYSWTGHFLANPPNRLAWLRFQSGSGIQFSRDARIMKIGSNVTGFGTATLPDGHKIDLKTVDTFNYESWRTEGVLYFSGPDFTGSTRGSFNDCTFECATTAP